MYTTRYTADNEISRRYTADDETPSCGHCDYITGGLDCCALCGPEHGWGGYLRTENDGEEEPEGSGRKGPAGDQVILMSKGRPFACTCGATVFTKGRHGARTVYYCSGCGQGWSDTERLTEK